MNLIGRCGRTAERVDAAGMLLHPGLINGHTHGHGNLAKGIGDRWSLELLLTAAPWIGGGRELEDKYLSTLIGAAEMLLKGCTAAYDLAFEFPAPTTDGMAAMAKAYKDVGCAASWRRWLPTSPSMTPSRASSTPCRSIFRMRSPRDLPPHPPNSVMASSWSGHPDGHRSRRRPLDA